jgi:hypothetical protein
LAKKSKRKATRETEQYDQPFELDVEEEPVRTAPKYRAKLAYLIDQDEVNALIYATERAAAVEGPPKQFYTSYPTYSIEEVLALLEGNYVPSKPRKK